MYHLIRKAAMPASILALAMWAGLSFGQTRIGTTGAVAGNRTAATMGTSPTGVTTTGTPTIGAGMSALSTTGAYGYGVGNFGSVGLGYGIQVNPNAPITNLNPMTGPVGYGYGVGNYGTAGYMMANSRLGATGGGFGASTTPAGPSGYGYGVGTNGTLGYGYGLGNYNNPAMANRNPYTLGAYTGTFSTNGLPAVNNPMAVPSTGAVNNPALFNPSTMSMNGIFANQFGPFGLATGTTPIPSTAPPTSQVPTSNPSMMGTTTTGQSPTSNLNTMGTTTTGR